MMTKLLSTGKLLNTIKLLGAALVLCPSLAIATSVQFQTSMGDIEVELYDNTTPQTVANFLAYVEDESYNNTFFHRLVPGFILQGGGFSVDENKMINPIAQKPSVANEPVLANVRGTIAMAKQSNRPNSATNQWFFNLNNNTQNLDNQNEGFTVFGQVTQGMDVINAIAAITGFDQTVNTVLRDAPLRDWTEGNIFAEHVIVIERIVVLNADPNSADDLMPTATTMSPQGDSKSSGGSRSLYYIALLLLVLALKRYLKISISTQRRHAA